MDGSVIIGWIIVPGAGHLFWPAFRREANGWIVKLADKVRDDTDKKP